MGRTTLQACRRVRRLLAVALVTTSVALASRAASADGNSRPLSEALDVEPGATCVTAAALGEHVRAWLGSDEVDSDLWIRVKGSEDDPRDVFFTMGREDQVLARRRFQPGPDRCDDLQAALGLAIALAIRVSLIDGIAPTAVRPPPARRDVWALEGDGLASWDVLPGGAFGVGVRVERSLPPNFEMRLGFEGLGAWDKTFDHVSGTFDATLFSLRLDACVTFALGGPVGALGCFGFEAGGLYAQGKNFTTPQGSFARWLALANAFGVTIEVTPHWSVQWTLTLALPLEHPRIGVQTSSGAVVDARELAAVGGELAFGPAYRF